MHGCGIQIFCTNKKNCIEKASRKKVQKKNSKISKRNKTRQNCNEGRRISEQDDQQKRINRERKKNCTLPMIPTACLLFLRRLSLIKYRARTRSSEKVLMCVFIENLFTLIFDKCTLFISLFLQHTHTYTRVLYEWMLHKIWRTWFFCFVVFFFLFFVNWFFSFSNKNIVFLFISFWWRSLLPL